LRASGRTVKAELKAIWFEKANDDASDAVPPRRVRSIAATAARSHSSGLRHPIERTLDLTKARPPQSLTAAAVHRVAQGPERGERSAAFRDAAPATP
jgi:hypothetical protein